MWPLTGTFNFLVHNLDDGGGQVADDERNENDEDHFSQAPIASSATGSRGGRSGMSLNSRSRPGKEKKKKKETSAVNGLGAQMMPRTR
jgi:hypothetical protein